VDTLGTDSLDYPILIDGCRAAFPAIGPTVEIGTREGGSSQMIMQTFAEAGKHRPHIAIDPYGNIEYAAYQGGVYRADYTNTMRNRAISALYKVADELNYNFIYMPLTDTEYFARFADGMPIYDEYATLCSQYSLVFFDGPHERNAIADEIAFFGPRMSPVAVWVFDDVLSYLHMTLEEDIAQHGFTVLGTPSTRKKSYIKTEVKT
jgi:hypothetical protein